MVDPVQLQRSFRCGLPVVMSVRRRQHVGPHEFRKTWVVWRQPKCDRYHDDLELELGGFRHRRGFYHAPVELPAPGVRIEFCAGQPCAVLEQGQWQQYRANLGGSATGASRQQGGLFHPSYDRPDVLADQSTGRTIRSGAVGARTAFAAATRRGREDGERL